MARQLAVIEINRIAQLSETSRKVAPAFKRAIELEKDVKSFMPFLSEVEAEKFASLSNQWIRVLNRIREKEATNEVARISGEMRRNGLW